MKLEFQPRTEFAEVLSARSRAYVAAQDQGPIRRRMLTKTAIILSWFVLSYVLLVFVAAAWWQGVLLSISLALSVAAVGFGVQHDANHDAYPVGPRFRRALGYCLDIIGGSSFIWRIQHNQLHHPYTNVSGADEDIDLFPYARLAPTQRRLAVHRYQHLYVWFFYSMIVVRWLLWADLVDLIRGRCGGTHFRRPRGWALAGLLGGKAVALMLWIGLPLLLHPPLIALLFVFLTLSMLGLTLTVIFELAHVLEETKFPEAPGEPRRVDTDWVSHQLATTANFAPQNRWLSWFLGGLNFQIEHHLQPRVCHLHYPGLARITAETCREFGVPYNVHHSVWAALRSHVRVLRRMGRPAVGTA